MSRLFRVFAVLLLCACAEPDVAVNAVPRDMPAEQVATIDTNPTIITIATGRFISVVPDGTYTTLDHDPIPAINMGAMRMGFDIDPALDLSGYSEGDTLRFRLFTSEETGFMITAICRPATDGPNCL